MGEQLNAFLDGEGDAWLRRNSAKLPIADDPVMGALERGNISPSSVLEIGCSNGWRLKLIEEKYNPHTICGIDPAVSGAQENGRIIIGGADVLPYGTAKFDLVIYGFCLYLCDREDLFRIASEGDRVLRNGGHMLIYDFLPETPYSKKYAHKQGLRSYKMDYSRLWLCNPAYRLLVRYYEPQEEDKQTAVTILRKDILSAWPEISS